MKHRNTLFVIVGLSIISAFALAGLSSAQSP